MPPPSKPPPKPPGRFALFTQKWAAGCGDCSCAAKGTRRVHARGAIPCDVAFIGQAPGDSENALGVPFVGPAGALLDKIVADALMPWQVEGTVGPAYNSVRTLFLNVVACYPLNSETGKREFDPSHEQVQACRPRTEELLALARPRLVIAVGDVARKALVAGMLHSVRVPPSVRAVVDITHPGSILRANYVSQGILIQTATSRVRTAVAEYVAEGE